MLVLFFLFLWDGTAKLRNSTQIPFECNTVERTPFPASVYAPPGQAPLAPYKWVCNLFEAECTAFMIRHQTQGVLLITSGSCLYGRNAQNVNGDLDCPIFGSIRTDINNYVYHPTFLVRQAADPPIQGHAYDLAGLFDTSLGANRADGTPEGFEINFPNPNETNLELVGYIGTNDLRTQYRHDCTNVKYQNRYIEYESPAKWGDCITTGSPIFQEVGDNNNPSFQVFAVNQDDVLFATSIDGIENTRYDCYGYAAYCQGVSTGGAYGYEELMEGGTGYGYGYGYPGGEEIEAECQLPKITGCEFYGSTVDAQMVRWKEDGEGWMWGDPHYTTFDGFRYNFYDDCTYYLVNILSSNFFVSVHNYRQPYSVTKSMTVKFGFNEFTVGQQCAFKFRGGRSFQSFIITLPFRSKFLSIVRSATKMEITVGNGAYITWNCASRYEIFLPESLRGVTQGILGNWNQDPDDDCRNPQNFIVPCKTRAEQEAWVNTWKVPGGECGNDGSSAFVEKKVSYSKYLDAQNQCSQIDSPPFDNCPKDLIATVIAGCEIDVVNVPDGDPLCGALQQMADSCAVFQKGVLNWRDVAPFSTICPPPDCSPGTVYNPCGDLCTHTCSNYLKVADTCKRVCTPLCECPTGQSLDRTNNCRPTNKCGVNI